MAKTPKPKRPKTAWELCERVCEAIQAHPLNYYQDYFVARRGGSLPEALDTPANACGTAYCRAGWMVVIADGADWCESYRDRACELLGMKRWQINDTTSEICRLFGAWLNGPTPGTKAYVRRGVSGLRRFMTKHEAHLRAHRLPPRPR